VASGEGEAVPDHGLPPRGGARTAAEPFFTAAIHRDDAGRKQHEDMGFHHVWSMALARLAAMAKG
jgi:hypothetical protein